MASNNVQNKLNNEISELSKVINLSKTINSALHFMQQQYGEIEFPIGAVEFLIKELDFSIKRLQFFRDDISENSENIQNLC